MHEHEANKSELSAETPHSVGHNTELTCNVAQAVPSVINTTYHSLNSGHKLTTLRAPSGRSRRRRPHSQPVRARPGGLVMPRFGSVWFRGGFCWTLNWTVGPVQENPWTRTWTLPKDPLLGSGSGRFARTRTGPKDPLGSGSQRFVNQTQRTKEKNANMWGEWGNANARGVIFTNQTCGEWRAGAGHKNGMGNFAAFTIKVCRRAHLLSIQAYTVYKRWTVYTVMSSTRKNMIQVGLKKRTCRAIFIMVLTSKGTHNSLIIPLCLSRGTHMSIAVGTLQYLQCLEYFQCQPVVLLWVGERRIRITKKILW